MPTSTGYYEPPMRRIPMSYDDYLALDEKVHAEWVDGVVVVSPAAGVRHQRAVVALLDLLRGSLDGLEILPDVSAYLPGNRERRPDLLGITSGTRGDDGVNSSDLWLVVEVHSPSTKSEDLLRKAPEYLGAGIQQYWLVDPFQSYVEVLRNAEERWETVAYVDDAHPEAVVDCTPYGAVQIRLADIVGG